MLRRRNNGFFVLHTVRPGIIFRNTNQAFSRAWNEGEGGAVTLLSVTDETATAMCRSDVRPFCCPGCTARRRLPVEK